MGREESSKLKRSINTRKRRTIKKIQMKMMRAWALKAGQNNAILQLLPRMWAAAPSHQLYPKLNTSPLKQILSKRMTGSRFLSQHLSSPKKTTRAVLRLSRALEVIVHNYLCSRDNTVKTQRPRAPKAWSLYQSFSSYCFSYQNKPSLLLSPHVWSP